MRLESIVRDAEMDWINSFTIIRIVKQATFLQAQSKAMKALSDMIKQYDELCQSEAATEEQRLRIDKLRIEVDAMKNSQGNDDEVKIIDDLEVSDDGDTAE